MPKFKTYPLESISPEEALKKQFKLVDTMTRHFMGDELLSRGDLGVVPGLNQPRYTKKVEEVLADYFGVKAAMLVRGSGTAAIRLALHSTLKPGDTVLVHKAPIYPTTKVSIDSMGIKTNAIDYNDIENQELPNDISAILIQYTRQQPEDSYSMEKVISFLKVNYPKIPIITDDNYAVMKVRQIGVELGANLSCFSTFKLLGPEGIGCIVGNKREIDQLRKENYSGGSQVQGHEALDVLRGLTYAPVALANQALVVNELVKRLNNKEIPEVSYAYVANAQSKVLLIEFENPIAQEILKYTNSLGAAPNPVGAESKYEIVPMFYRVSGTFKEYDPELLKTTIRINPYRCGADTIIRILKDSISKVVE
ncbi:aminotransferase class I/II-fold pyridoxal phosphate-dependent enzyme [Companilactobacillus kimchiensis]|uniref:Cystathionine beta-lyase family protein n=1 Tax=Companilactobacillus kimchiensis TaxID=993692 RepID=A0A0R2LL82_9LACO|nr:aminotransferase class I/II-fold pyridoxal phosphate-dependent enzyme [Companilactobacillus kimchiensis]KRO00112.1 cystathionine beta-lyase family protein [Companilactobacillus kimchiensis]